MSKNKTEVTEQIGAKKSPNVKTKVLRNNGFNKVELILDGKNVTVVKPGDTVTVPANYVIPKGVSLIERL